MNNASLVGDWAETRSFVVLSTLSSISLYVRYVKSFYRIISEGRIIVDSTPKSAPIQSTKFRRETSFVCFFHSHTSEFSHLSMSANESSRTCLTCSSGRKAQLSWSLFANDGSTCGICNRP